MPPSAEPAPRSPAPAEQVPAPIPLLGMLGHHPVTLEQAVRLIAERPADAPFAFVVTPNAQTLVEYSKPGNPVREPFDAAWLRLCDGQVPRMLARWAQGVDIPLAPGSDLTVALLRDVVRPDEPVAIIGGDAELAERLRRQYGLRGLVQHQPPMGLLHDAAAIQACVDFVLANPARITFAAVSAEPAARVMLAIQRTGRATGIGLTIGSSLLFATGLVPRAPAWMRRAGLEWLFRVAREPRRLGRRYLVGSTPVLWWALKAWWRGRSRVPTRG